MPKWQARRAPQSTTLTFGSNSTKTQTAREIYKRVKDERERYELYELYQQREGMALGYDKKAFVFGLMRFKSLLGIAWRNFALNSLLMFSPDAC